MGIRHTRHFAQPPTRIPIIKPVFAQSDANRGHSHRIRDAVWVKYNSDRNIGTCYCCGTHVDRYDAGWHCSHVKSNIKGGTYTIDNLRPCCRHCNLSMGNQNLYVYMQENHMKGPGSKHINHYLAQHPGEKHDKRTNNWGNG